MFVVAFEPQETQGEVLAVLRAIGVGILAQRAGSDRSTTAGVQLLLSQQDAVLMPLPSPAVQQSNLYAASQAAQTAQTAVSGWGGASGQQHGATSGMGGGAGVGAGPMMPQPRFGYPSAAPRPHMMSYTAPTEVPPHSVATQMTAIDAIPGMAVMPPPPPAALSSQPMGGIGECPRFVLLAACV
jgi:hypothetical protein